MSLGNLFIARTGRKAEKGAPVAAAAPEGAVGVFITPKSLMSFPVASLVVTFTWALAKRLSQGQGAEGWGDKSWVPVLVSLVVGAVIFVASTADPDAKPKSRREWIIAVAVALFNSLYLAAASLGLLKL